MANQNEKANKPATERVTAPETATAVEARVPQAPVYVPTQPRQKQIERLGGNTSQYSVRWPQVRGGICEFCGVLDKNVPSQFQYKLCGHYRGQQLRCTYCPDSKDADDVIYHADLNIAEHPDNPEKLIVWCNSYDCSRAHEQRFKRSSS